MNKLLKEAIADAKAVRETALANAKIALEEAFTPRLQSMLSARLSEADDEMYEEEEELEAPAPEMTEEGEENDTDGTPNPGPAIEEEDDMEMDEEGLDLESIIRELEGDSEEMYEEEEEEAPAPAPEMTEEGEEEDSNISIDEIINALREADGEDEEVVKEEEEDVVEEEEDEKESAKVEEAYRVIKFLKNKINEVNLLNAKLLFSNKLFRNYELNESQKMKVIENFDRANNLREVKLVFSTLCESLTVSKTAKKQNIKEGYASKPVRSTAPKKEILSESNALANRWKKLANLK
jgi:hypothetical protein